ncbi:MAG: hypothetical protein HKO65_20630 [Gemmatimonadetes bacterium]|nr:hypothetical protein [Gemmatimonadota bacterium]NNM07509.1 hypothetical protein [Gemmatimonadota bacterium]
MNRWMRRVRGALGMGLAWGLAWFGAGMVIMLGFLLTTGSTGADVPYPLGFGAFGFVAGVTFSGVVGLLEGRRRFDQMSLPRFAGWGAVGGLLLSTVFVLAVALTEDISFLSNLVVLGPIFAGAGAACASGALALARRAEDGAFLESGEDVVKVGLTESEKADLRLGP